MGHIQSFKSWEDVLAVWPNAIASKVAILTKDRPDGTVKVRLIIDLRRSGGNANAVLPVQPQISGTQDPVGTTMADSDAPM